MTQPLKESDGAELRESIVEMLEDVGFEPQEARSTLTRFDGMSDGQLYRQAIRLAGAKHEKDRVRFEVIQMLLADRRAAQNRLRDATQGQSLDGLWLPKYEPLAEEENVEPPDILTTLGWLGRNWPSTGYFRARKLG